MTIHSIYDLIGQTVFARWNDGYYYPGRVDSVGDYEVKISFFDGDNGTAKHKHVMPLEQGMRELSLQGNWLNRGIFFRGSVSGESPMIMHYADGDVEEIQLAQLRGARPGETPIVRRIWGAVAVVAIVGVVAFGVSRLR